MIPATTPISSFSVNRPVSSAQRPEITSVVKPGKSGQAVGQLAKAAIAMAQVNGVELPKNAQGIASSAIARGADPEALFRLQTEETAETVPTAEDTGPTVPTDESIRIAPIAADNGALEIETGIEARAEALAAYEETSLLSLRPANLPSELV